MLDVDGERWEIPTYEAEQMWYQLWYVRYLILTYHLWYGGWNLSYSRLKFSIYTCTSINDDVITQYNPNQNHNNKKGIKFGT